MTPPQRRTRLSHRRRLQNKIRIWLVTATAGGALYGTCETRVHDAIVDGTQLFVLSLLDPSNISIAGDTVDADDLDSVSDGELEARFFGP